MTVEASLVWPVEATLGEGPLWWPADAALWFVDIKGGALQRYDPASGERHSFAVGGRPSFVVLADDGSLLVGSGNELRPFREGRLGEPIATIPMPAHNRTNDATVDPQGRLWFGTMDDEEAQPTGAVYRFEGGTLAKAGGECTITNGPAVSPDGCWLYYADTLAGIIWRFDISERTTLEEGTRFVTIDKADGGPDGLTIDSEGHLWIAIWGGSEARRYAPDGTLVMRVALPCSNVTKVAFGGPDLRTGFVTTARVGLTDEQRAAQPLAGGLFTFAAPAAGLAPSAVRLG